MLCKQSDLVLSKEVLVSLPVYIMMTFPGLYIEIYLFSDPVIDISQKLLDISRLESFKFRFKKFIH